MRSCKKYARDWANPPLFCGDKVFSWGKRSSHEDRLGLFAGGEVGAIGMVEHQRADAGFRFHHHAFGELHADFFWAQQFPDTLLVVEIWACGVAEAVAFAAVPGGEALLHGHGRRIREAPILADSAVQPFRASFSGLDGESLESMRLKVESR